MNLYFWICPPKAKELTYQTSCSIRPKTGRPKNEVLRVSLKSLGSFCQVLAMLLLTLELQEVRRTRRPRTLAKPPKRARKDNFTCMYIYVPTN